MLREIPQTFPWSAPARSTAQPIRPEAPSAATPSASASVSHAANPAGAQGSVERSLLRAASTLFPERAVRVEGFRDEASGRFVYRVADRVSGEVLLQMPPEALLRFFASAQEALGPLLEIEA